MRNKLRVFEVGDDDAANTFCPSIKMDNVLCRVKLALQIAVLAAVFLTFFLNILSYSWFCSFSNLTREHGHLPHLVSYSSTAVRHGRAQDET